MREASGLRRWTCRDWAGMVDAKVEMEMEADRVFSGSYFGRLGLGAVVPRPLVAAEIITTKNLRGEGGLEAVVVLADVFKGARLDAVEHQMRK